MDGLAVPCLDPDNATDGSKKLYAMYVQGLRAVDSNITDAEKKSITNYLKNANKAINASCEEQRKCRANDQITKNVEQRVVAVSNDLADKEITAAKLRTDYSSNRLNLQLIQANLEKLMATCRALAMQTNQIVIENKNLEEESNKSCSHWDNASSQLGHFVEKMNTLINNSSKLNSRNQASKRIAELQSKLEELQEQKQKLIERQTVLTQEDSNTGEEDFMRYASSLAKTLLKFYSNIERFQTHLNEKRVVLEKEAERMAAQTNIMDMSMADLDDTAVLLQANGRNIDGEAVEEPTEDDEATPPAATEEDLSAARDQTVRNYVAEQSSNSSEPYQAPSDQIVESSTHSENDAVSTEEEEYALAEEPEAEQVVSPEDNISEDVAAEQDENLAFSEFNSGLSQDIGNLDVNFDAETVLDISMHSNDPGADFLSMIHSNSAKEKGTGTGDDFSFSMFTANDAAGGDSGSGFNFDGSDTFNFNAGDGAPESSFNFNFAGDGDASQNNNAGDFDFGFNFN